MSKRPFTARFKRWETPVFLLYAGVTVLFTYPAITLFSRTYAEPMDPLGTLWGLWWFKYAVAHHLPTSVVTLANVPFNLQLGRHSSDLLTAYTLRGAALLTSETVAYNLWLLACFFLSAVSMFYLVKYLTRSPAAAAFSGLAFGFCPYMLMHGKEHVGLTMTFLMPLFTLALIKAWRRRTHRSILWCAAVFLLLALFSIQYGLLMGVFAVCFLATLWIGGRPWRGLKRAPGTLLPRLLLLSGIVIAVAAVLLLTTRNLFSFRNPVSYLYMYSARPWDYFIPHAEGALFGGLTGVFINSHLHGGFAVENSLFLGYVPLALAVTGALAVLRRRGASGGGARSTSDSEQDDGLREPAPAVPSASGERGRTRGDAVPAAEDTRRLVWGFMVSGVVAFIFSMPPTAKVFGVKLYMPSHILFKVVPQFRAYARFGIIVMMCVAVLAGYGTALLAHKVRSRKYRALLLALLMAMVLLEFTIVPPFRSLDTAKITDYFRWLKNQPGKPVAAVYPLFEGNHFDNYYYLFQQRLHRKKLINGSRMEDPGDVYRWAILDITNPGTPGLLKARGTDYVMVIPDLYSAQAVQANYVFPSAFDESRVAPGLRLVRRFSDCLVYKVTAPPADFVPLFTGGSFTPYRDPAGDFWYPGTNKVTVRIQSRLKHPAVCDIRLRMKSTTASSRVTFTLNGRLLTEVRAPVRPVDVVLGDVTVEPGRNTLEIDSDGPSRRLTEIPLYAEANAAVFISDIQVERKR